MALPEAHIPTGATRPAAPETLGEMAARVRPVSLAGDHLLPVLPPFAGLLPGGGLRRGSTVAVAGAPRSRPSEGRAPAGGGTSLALALLAGASRAGSWCAGVGLPALGLVAAAELGVALERFPQVAEPPPGEWVAVVAALLDGFDIVVVRPPGRVRTADGRRLVARARERGAVLVQVGGDRGPAVWPDGPDLALEVAASEWQGLADGHGHLRARRVEVVVTGRRQAAREQRQWLWLPRPGGGVAVADPPARPAVVHRLDRSGRGRRRAPVEAQR